MLLLIGLGADMTNITRWFKAAGIRVIAYLLALGFFVYVVLFILYFVGVPLITLYDWVVK